MFVKLQTQDQLTKTIAGIVTVKFTRITWIGCGGNKMEHNVGYMSRFAFAEMFKFITNVIGKLAYIPCYNQCGLLA